MIFGICLLIVVTVALTSSSFIKKNAKLLYVLSTVISTLVVTCTAMGASNRFPQWFQAGILNPLAWGAFATAIFVVVMFAGAVSRGSMVQKKLMPIRAELSIIASILTLGHNFSAGQTYFVLLFTQPLKLPVNQLMAAICSVVMLCIMLPLFITSFSGVRKKMSAKAWKKLQRGAYVFYGLIYVHVLLLAIPRARLGHTSAMINIAVFSLVFLVYGSMRLRKALSGASTRMKNMPAVIAVCICIAVTAVSVPRMNPKTALPSVSQTPEGTAQEENEGDQLPAEKSSIDEERRDSSENKESQLPSAAKAEDNKNHAVKEKPDTAEEEEASAAKSEMPKESTEEKPLDEAPAVQIPEPEPPQVTYKYKNGTFRGSGEGYGGTITVNITIKDDIISGISVESHNEDEPFWSDGKAVINSILSSQSANVNGISGATFSSSGIKQAVNAALNSAKN